MDDTSPERGGFASLVVGVDGSGPGAAALDWAAERIAPSAVLHVVSAFTPEDQLGRSILRQDWVAARHQLAESLEGTWTENARQRGCQVETHVVDDDPADALMRIASETGAEAMVVGHRGTGLRSHLLGAVTAKLLHQAVLPVVVVGESDNDAPDTDDHIVAAADHDRAPVVACVGYGEATEQAAAWAAHYARASGRRLALVHAVGFRPLYPLDSPVESLAYYLGPDVSMEWADEDLRELAERIRADNPGLTVTATVEMGLAVPVMESVSAGADLLVMGRRRHNVFARATLSPRIQRLVVRSGAPVAVVPECPNQS